MKKAYHTIFFILAVVFIVCAACVIIQASKDVDELEQFRSMEDDTTEYRLNEDNLKTLEDSIHFYEDGF